MMAPTIFGKCVHPCLSALLQLGLKI